jgi:hypothetical protein
MSRKKIPVRKCSPLSKCLVLWTGIYEVESFEKKLGSDFKQKLVITITTFFTPPDNQQINETCDNS